MTTVVSKEDAQFVRGFKARCENIAVQYRSHLGLSQTDPLSPRELAEYLDVTILDLDTVPTLAHASKQYLQSIEGDEWSAVAIQSCGRDVILVNPSHSIARQSNDLMHELAHIILQHEQGKVYISSDSLVNLRTFNPGQEAEADWLAGCLLLPRPALEIAYKAKLAANIAAKQYQVSVELYTYRLRMSGVEKQLSYRRR